MKAIQDSDGKITVFNSTPKNWGAVICGFNTFSNEKLQTYGFYDVVRPTIKESQELGDIEWDADNSVFTYPVQNKTYSQTVAEMKTQKIDHTAEAVGKLTPDYEISCSLLEPIITGQNPYQTRNQVL